MKKLMFVIATLVLAGCASKEILPEKVEVKVTRDEPSKNCNMIGPVSGSTTKIGQSAEVSMENIKKDAARKGANFVKYESSSADGSGLKGLAYYCP